jgi:hypothetical protein
MKDYCFAFYLLKIKRAFFRQVILLIDDFPGEGGKITGLLLPIEDS